IASADSYTTDDDTPLLHAALPIYATDVDGDPLTAILVSGPSHGSLTLNGNGSFTFTPAANYNGSDSFVYKVNDGTADSNLATVRSEEHTSELQSPYDAECHTTPEK